MIRNSLILFAPMGRGIRLNDIKKLRCRLAPVARHIERVESGFRELSATTPIRSPKSVPDTVSRSREFQVHIHPRARVETVHLQKDRIGSWKASCLTGAELPLPARLFVEVEEFWKSGNIGPHIRLLPVPRPFTGGKFGP